MKQSFRAWLPCVAKGLRKARWRTWGKSQLRLNHRNHQQPATDIAELQGADKSSSSTPSPSGVQITKKPNVPEQRTYAQAAAGISRVAIVQMAYPDRKFDEEEVALLKRLVKKRVPNLGGGTKAPIFQGTSDRDGAVIFNCADVETVEWLKSLTTVLEDPEMSVKETLELLDRQNKGLATSEWIVVRGSDSRDVTSAHFAAWIGDRPLEELKVLSFKPYCGQL
jgi:hypothetical protein